HQGIGLQIPPYKYADVHDLIERAADSATPGLVVALDNITDPRNLGAVIRSVAAFGGHGVVIPERRSASVTAVTWRTSAGTAARLPVAKATNMVRALKQFQQNGRSEERRVGKERRSEEQAEPSEGEQPGDW